MSIHSCCVRNPELASLTLFVRRNGHGNAHTTHLPNGNKSDALASLKEALASFKDQAASLDVETRHAMIATLHEAAESIEAPGDMLMRLCETVREKPALANEAPRRAVEQADQKLFSRVAKSL